MLIKKTVVDDFHKFFIKGERITKNRAFGHKVKILESLLWDYN